MGLYMAGIEYGYMGNDGGDVYFDAGGSVNRFCPGGEGALLPNVEGEAEMMQRQTFGGILREGLKIPENLACDARLQRVLFGRLAIDGEMWHGAAQELVGAACREADLESGLDEALEYRRYVRGIQEIRVLGDDDSGACGVEIEYEEAPSAKGGIEKKTTQVVLGSNPDIEGSFEVIDTWREFRGAGSDRIARFDEQRMGYEASGRMYVLGVMGGGNTMVRETDGFDSFPEKQVRGNIRAISGSEIVMDEPRLVEDDGFSRKYKADVSCRFDEDFIESNYDPTEMGIDVYDGDELSMCLRLPDWSSRPIHMYGRPMGVAVQFVDPTAMDRIDWSGRASSLPGQWASNEAGWF
jgi:hypothetical protein